MTPALQQFADRLRLLGVDANPTFAAGPPATLSISVLTVGFGQLLICTPTEFLGARDDDE